MRGNIALVLGVVMLLIGVWLATRPLWAHGRPLTGQLWLDMAFAAFFLLRGGMNVRSAQRSRYRPPRDGGAPP